MNNPKKIFFSILAMFLFFGIGEIILRAVDFKYSNTPLEMRIMDREGLVQHTLEYNNQDGVVRFKKDSVQFWVPVWSFENTTPHEKQSHVKRIATLGDSCTQVCVDADAWSVALDSPSAYPDFLQTLLKTKIENYTVEVLNASVGSYSSFQGLKRLEYVVLKYNPDLLTIFFGWNDHWVARQQDKGGRSLNSFQVVFYNSMEKFRFFQYIHYLVARITQNPFKNSSPEKFHFELRVPLPDYEKNLNAMIDLAQDRKIPVVLITAPHDLKSWKPMTCFPWEKEALLEMHQRYNAIVRITAERRGVYLLDLEKIMQQQPPDKLMSQDGIHFTSKGCHFVAETLAKKILDEKILSQ